MQCGVCCDSLLGSTFNSYNGMVKFGNFKDFFGCSLAASSKRTLSLVPCHYNKQMFYLRIGSLYVFSSLSVSFYDSESGTFLMTSDSGLYFWIRFE